MILRLDHFVLTVASIQATCHFYETILKMERVENEGRVSLRFGDQKINLHQSDATFDPKAHSPTPGSADFCLLTRDDLSEVRGRLDEEGVPIEIGPIERNGALGPMTSIYFRDPDRNLVEISKY